MNGYLLDTNIISMLSPSHPQATPSFLTWLRRADDAGDLFLSVVSIHEIEKGIALLDRKGASAKASDLKIWLLGLLSTYGDKILGIDAKAAALGGQLEAKAAAAGHNVGMADAAIAGIAKANGLTIVTANLKDFQPLGVDVLGPEDVG